MAVLVDEAIWSWRGRKWAHLVSDTSLAELHELARSIGMPYVAFQGDHYDVHETLRELAIEAGARPTPSRDLVRALRRAGLRRSGPHKQWEWTSRSNYPAPLSSTHLFETVAETYSNTNSAAVLPESFTERLAEVPGPVEVAVATRESEQLLLVSNSYPKQHHGEALRLSNGEWLHHTTGERGTYLELVTPIVSTNGIG